MFEIKSIGFGVFAVVTTSGGQTLSMGTTPAFALENFEKRAAKFIKEEHAKMKPTVVSNDRGDGVYPAMVEE